MNYFQFQLSKTNGEQDNSEVKSALPGALLTKVASFKYRHIVTRSDCFVSTSGDFLAAIFEKLNTRFLMPKEVLFNRGDMGREVCFVENGELEVYADNEAKILLRKVVNNAKDSTMVGELSFFLTIPQPDLVVSKSSGDCTLLTLSKDDYNSCVLKYPECHPIVVKKLCAEMGLSENGDDLAVGGVGVGVGANAGAYQPEGGGGEDKKKVMPAEGKSGEAKQNNKAARGEQGVDDTDEVKVRLLLLFLIWPNC